MEKGLFLKNWEIASIFDIIQHEQRHWKLLPNEQEVSDKLENYIKKVAKEWEESE